MKVMPRHREVHHAQRQTETNYIVSHYSTLCVFGCCFQIMFCDREMVDLYSMTKKVGKENFDKTKLRNPFPLDLPPPPTSTNRAYQKY
jgi:hypothetical protein